MKFPSLKGGRVMDYALPELCGGLNLNEDPSAVGDSCITECKNMYYSKGLLATRQGLNATSSDLFMQFKNYGGNFIIDYTFTESFATYNGEQCRIAYCVTGDISSYGDINVILIGRGGKRYSIGAIHYTRASSQSFFSPEKLFFVVGKGKKGCGIYAFVTFRNIENNDEISHTVYECSSDMSSWSAVNQGDFYSPVIYVNGRGNKYGTGTAYYEGVPIELEQPNLLTGAFRAYFTTDGYSSEFQLPVSGLDEDRNVICYLYKNRTEHTDFVIPAGADSVTTAFMGVRITMKCDRSTGLISFYTSGAEYAVPRMNQALGNNMRILAYKTEKDGFARVVGSSQAVNYSSRVFLCGNEIAAGEVYSARLTDPLYFPKSAVAVVGEPSAPVTALGVQNDKLIAFKKRGIYRIVLQHGGVYATNSYLSEQTQEITLADTLSTVGVHIEIGCDCPNTLRLCGSRLVWLNSDGRVYVLAMTTYGKENNIYEISSAIRPALREYSEVALKRAFAAENDGSYYLFLGKRFMVNEVFVMDYRVKSFGQSESYLGSHNADRALAWYYWKFPEAVIFTSAAGVGDCLMTAIRNFQGSIAYTALVTGKSDKILEVERGELREYNYDIESAFSTKPFDFGKPHIKKCITALFITAHGKGHIRIRLSDGKRVVSDFIRNIGEGLNEARFNPCVRLVGRASLKISSDKGISVAPPVMRCSFGVGL